MATVPNRQHKPRNCFGLSASCSLPSIDPKVTIRLPWFLSLSSPIYETAATRREVLPPVSETGGDYLGSFAPPAGRRPGYQRAHGGRGHRNQRAGTPRGRGHPRVVHPAQPDVYHNHRSGGHPQSIVGTGPRAEWRWEERRVGQEGRYRW